MGTSVIAVQQESELAFATDFFLSLADRDSNTRDYSLYRSRRSKTSILMT